MRNDFDLLKKILELIGIILGLLIQTKTLFNGIKSRKRPSRGRPHSRTKKKK